MGKSEFVDHTDQESSGSTDSDERKYPGARLSDEGRPPVTPKRQRSGRALISRQVSHEWLSGLKEAASNLDNVEHEVYSDYVSSVQTITAHHSGRQTITLPGPPIQTSHNLAECRSPRNGIPPMPNPVYKEHFYRLHSKALRLETALHPLKHILYRLMFHASLNRKGLFNSPVDPVSMQAPDYFAIVKIPMDLGTIKRKLHSMSYCSFQDAVNDIRLCFRNAMLYNPPSNPVHVNARSLLHFFEEQLQTCHFDENSDSETALDVVLRLPRTKESLRATWSDTRPPTLQTLPPQNARKRKLPGPKQHSCSSCGGQSCYVCGQGCLPLEHSLLICNGDYCFGARIRKNDFYHISPDGHTIFCQKCYKVLPSALTEVERDRKSSCRYKSDLLKRKNDEEVFESWITCVTCQKAAHHVCALFNPFAHTASEYECPSCSKIGINDHISATNYSSSGMGYTYVAGEELPVPLAAVVPSVVTLLNAHDLPRSPIADFMERKVRSLMAAQHIHSEQTVSVRIISESEKSFYVPIIIQRFFETNVRVHSQEGASAKTIVYKSKAIALFQTIDGLDVCIFCMYVQEYSLPEKRVYLAYLDSVEYFRPSSLRTPVYQEMITSYLATAKKRGFINAHIWACPPLRGNSFIFWKHPAEQRTPTMERLTSWYNCVLSRAIEVGVVTDVVSLYESDFEQPMAEIGKTEATRYSKMPCPPLLDGDFWIEEALRLYQITAIKQAKECTAPYTTPLVVAVDRSSESCPAVSLAAMVKDRIMPHPSSLAFRRPVNAVALKIRNYHDIIQKPMDLSTIFTKVSLGEYGTLSDFVDDAELMFSNAMKFNPKTNPVHLQAVALRNFFFRELNHTTKMWRGEYAETGHADGHSWRAFSAASLSLSEDFDRASLSTSRGNVHEGIMFSNDNPRRRSDYEGSNSIHIRMAGNDVDWFEKKVGHSSKKHKRHETLQPSVQDSGADQRRKQTWLGEQVGQSVRRLRITFFNCFLQEPGGQSAAFAEYCKVDSFECRQTSFCSRIADSRHGFLEFSQLRNLEYDTLRKAKYSTAIMLYHLHCDDASGVSTACSLCSQEVDKVRWHFVGKKPITLGVLDDNKAGQDVCGACFANCKNKTLYIPIPVSI